jgi:DNA-binding CsgD family transcriptional regulator
MNLTERQKEVLRGLTWGKTTKGVAADLGISPKTVEYHRARLWATFGTNSLALLTRAAVKLGLGLALLLGLPATGADLKLAWDASPSAAVTNYVLVAHTNASAVGNYNLGVVRVHVGTNLTATLDKIAPGRWHLFVAAQAGGVYSEPSNVVVVDVPVPPATLRPVLLQYGATLDGMTNNLFMRINVP